MAELMGLIQAKAIVSVRQARRSTCSAKGTANSSFLQLTSH